MSESGTVEVEIEHLGRKDKPFLTGDGGYLKLDGPLMASKLRSNGAFLEEAGRELHLRCLFKCLNENFRFPSNGVLRGTTFEQRSNASMEKRSSIKTDTKTRFRRKLSASYCVCFESKTGLNR